MTKYRAKVDVPPGIKAGDVVDFKEPLVASYANHFVRADDDEEETHARTAGDNDDAVKTGIVNPSRDELKAKATELGINFASNVPTDRLMELIQEAEAKRQAGDGSEGQNGTNDDDNEE